MNLLIFTPILLFGEALTAALQNLEEMDLVATCNCAERLTEDIAKLEPEVLLFDMAGEDALAAARCIARACPSVYMIALALPEVPRAVISCADAGFVAYLPRHASLGELRQLVRMALRGETTCHPQVVASLLTELRRRQTESGPADMELLTKREAEVFRLLRRGLSNKEVARALNVSLSTVKAHVHSVLTKLHARSRSQAIARLRIEPWQERSA